MPDKPLLGKISSFVKHVALHDFYLPRLDPHCLDKLTETGLRLANCCFITYQGWLKFIAEALRI